MRTERTKVSAVDKAMELFADMMIEKLESFKGAWHKPWFVDGEMSWPANFEGREYNGLNSIMLLLHCEKEGYKLPRFLTFEGVQRLNEEGLPRVMITKGEKSFPVILYQPYYVKTDTGERINDKTYGLLSDDAKEGYHCVPRYRVFRVFNIAQTNLQEVRPDVWEKIEDEYVWRTREGGDAFKIDAVDRMISEGLWICPIKTGGADACYSNRSNEIRIPERKDFKDGESFYGTLFHEMVHSTGGKTALGRLKPASYGLSDYAREELVAELGAAMVCQLYGISRYIEEDSLPYMTSWIKCLKESPSYIKNVLTDVNKAVRMITRSLEETKKNNLDRTHASEVH